MYSSVRRGQLSNLVSLCVLFTVVFSAIQLGVADKTCLAADIKCVVKEKGATPDKFIQGAILTLIKGDLKLTEVTDENGEGTFTGLAPDPDNDYIIKVDPQCYDSKRRKVTLGTEDEVVTFNLDGVPDEQKGSLSGFVTDGATKNPISGATVTIDKGSSVETDVDGSYAVDCVEIDTHNISADAEGFVKKTEKGFDVVVDSTLDFTLFPPRIKGTVTDADTLEPLPDVLVEAFLDDTTKPPTATDKTNKGGKYALNLTPGTYKIRGSKFGFSPEVSPPADLGLETETVDLQLTGCEATLKGTVKEKGTKTPIPNAKVRITAPADEASETTTDSKGRFKFDQQCLIPGNIYTVEAEKPGFETKGNPLDPASPDENTLNFKLKAGTTTTITTTTTTTTTTTSSTTTTTTRTTTTTTIPPTGCEPCEGEDVMTFSQTCKSFTFAINGEPGPRTESLSERRDGLNRIINKCGSVTFNNSGNTYCVEINVRWGPFCIIPGGVSGRARRIGEGVGTTTTTRTTTSTTVTTRSTTTTTRTTTTTIVGGADVTGLWDGTITIPGLGTSDFTVCLTQDGTQFTGRVPEDIDNCLTLRGSISGANVTLSILLSGAEVCRCPGGGTLSGTATLSNSNNTMSGSFSGTACGASITGTFTIDKLRQCD